MLSNTQRAYLAGFFDGEGCISYSPAAAPALQIAQRRRETLDRLRAELPMGAIFIRKNGPGRSIWVWRITAREQCRQLLEEVRPYAREKRDQVELMLKTLDWPPKARLNAREELQRMKRKPQELQLTMQ